MDLVWIEVDDLKMWFFIMMSHSHQTGMLPDCVGDTGSAVMVY